VLFAPPAPAVSRPYAETLPPAIFSFTYLPSKGCKGASASSFTRTSACRAPLAGTTLPCADN